MASSTSATIDPVVTDDIPSIGQVTNSRALFIAEILAGSAAAILAIAIICCLCSGAARKRSRLQRSGSLTFIDGINGLEVGTAGRQTPDPAPAYLSASPLGALSPEVVDAISRVSIECRQSLVASILSSDSLQQQLAGAGSTSQISIISSIAENDNFGPIQATIHSEEPSSRSSMHQENNSNLDINNLPNNNSSGNSNSYNSSESENNGSESGLGGSSSLLLSSSNNDPSHVVLSQHLNQHLQERAPPSYDPSWRRSLDLPGQEPSRRYPFSFQALRVHRRNSDNRGTSSPLSAQRHSSDVTRSSDGLSAPLQRSGSINSPGPSSQQHPQTTTSSSFLDPADQPVRQLGSRRSISWTGSPIRFTLTNPAAANRAEGHSRNSSRSTFRSLLQRSPLSSSVTIDVPSGITDTAATALDSDDPSLSTLAPTLHQQHHPRSPPIDHISRFASDVSAETIVEIVETMDSPQRE